CRGRSPRLQRLEDPGPRVRGEVSSPRLSPAHSPAEVLSHARPPRRTRTSVRPAECRVSDRTVVRLENAIRACSGSPGTGSPNERGTMRKKTAPPRQEHPKASATERSGPNQTSGLIAKGEQGGRSARRSPTLDDRSHRTRRRGGRGVVAGPGSVLRGAERFSPGSTFMNKCGFFRWDPCSSRRAACRARPAPPRERRLARSKPQHHGIPESAAKSPQRRRTRSTPLRPQNLRVLRVSV